MNISSKVFKKREWMLRQFMRQGGCCHYCNQHMMLSFQGDWNDEDIPLDLAVTFRRKKWMRGPVLVHHICANDARDEEIAKHENRLRLEKLSDKL